MKLIVVAVGKLKEPAFRALADDYASRVRRYASLEEIEIDDLPAKKLLPVLLKASPSAHAVPLDASGEELSSQAFAKRIEQLASRGKGDIAFFIGGKEGLPPEVLRSGTCLSLSRMTMPHRLARVFLLEQLYRAMTILRGEPYGK